jgi:hypothetical protein
MPEEYEPPLKEMLPKQFKNLRLFAADPYDLILSKFERNSGKDRDDAAYLFKKPGSDTEVFGERYHKVLRLNLVFPAREELIFKLWIEMFDAEAKE